jgi:hypothetical protein
MKGEKTMKVRFGLLFLLLVASSAGAQGPDALQPAGNESLKRVIYAKGVQIYECRAQQWVLVGPEADLFDGKGNLVGRHFAGPQWEATGDGSKVLGTVKARAEATEAGAIPWLLLSTKSVGGHGYFSDVTSIQRVATRGGAAPGGGCPHDGLVARVAYSAEYHFFHQQ